MRLLKIFSWIVAALSMSYYRLLRDHSSVQFHDNAIILNALDEDMIPYGARHIWIPLENDDELSAWLVAPKGKYLLSDQAFPIVVMAPGFGNQKDMGLFQIAEAFSEDGIAALIIDYRGFGGSSRQHWKMRQYIHPWHHVEDIVAAVHFIRGEALLKENIDCNLIALWGGAFGGGHVVIAAERLGPELIKGVISQTPHLGGRVASWKAFKTRGIFKVLKLSALAFTDYFRSLLWLSPLYIKIISENQTDMSFLTVSSNDFKTYSSKHPKKYLGGWENKAPARSFFPLLLYGPAEHVANVKVISFKFSL